MMSKGNKMLIAIYRRAAGLVEAEYRQILAVHAGVASTTDPGMTQAAFDRVMAALERTLFLRVERGDVPDPIGHSEHIRRRDYWQAKLAATQAGRLSSRQQYKILELWRLLAPQIGFAEAEKDERAIAYFSGIVRNATGRIEVGRSPLTTAQAAAVIDALQDRLLHAGRASEQAQNLVSAGNSVCAEVSAEALGGCSRLN